MTSNISKIASVQSTGTCMFEKFEEVLGVLQSYKATPVTLASQRCTVDVLNMVLLHTTT